MILQALELTPNYSNVGRISVALARYAYFGDNVLRVSTLKRKGKQHAALDVHKFEALNVFVYKL